MTLTPNVNASLKKPDCPYCYAKGECLLRKRNSLDICYSRIVLQNVKGLKFTGIGFAYIVR
jgi:hypothetical protein